MPTKVDDKTFTDFGLREVVGQRNPLTPEFTEKTVSIPCMDGVWSFGHQIGTRSFEIPLKHLYNDIFKRQRFLNDLVAFLFDAYGKPRELKLIFDYEPDKYFLVKLAGQINPERLMYSNSFSITFRATDPKKYFLVDADEIRMSSHIPILSHVRPARHSFAITSNQIIKLINDGTLALRPRINISGTATSLTVKNPRTNQSFKITNIVSSKQIIVEGSTYMVTEGGIDTFSKLVGKFIDLLPGDNNLSITGENMNITISFKYKAQFM